MWALAQDPRARYGSTIAFARVFQAGVDGDALPHELPPLDEARPIEVVPLPVAPTDGPTPLTPPSAAAVSVPTHLGRDGSAPGLLARQGPLARRTATLRRLLWWAVAVLVLLNLLLALLLLVTQGRLPGVYEPAMLLSLASGTPR